MLALGALSMFFPMLTLILGLWYCSKNLDIIVQHPYRFILPMYLIPISLVLFTRDNSSVLLSADAIIGVIVPTTIFVFVVRKTYTPDILYALLGAIIVIYGSSRLMLFSEQLYSIFEQAMISVQNILPAQYSGVKTENTMALMKLFYPAVWTLQLIIAMVIGIALFNRQIGLPLRFSDMRVNKWYGLVIILIAPLYLSEAWHPQMWNMLVAYCILPMLQGVSVMIAKLSRIISNPLLNVLIVLILLANSISYIMFTLLGVADQWLDFRKTNTGGISNESNHA